jgi:ABC-2 type transport system permease protein
LDLHTDDPGLVARLGALVRHELRRLLAARAFWAMSLLLALLTGFSFIEAVRLFGAASRTAQDFPELARGMAPLDGILVPTLGAFYLGTTLLFPFVAIRALGQDKESGALKLALQWPVSAGTLIGAKALAVGAAWCLTLAIPCSALVFWSAWGGHLALAETANLFFGHALYALMVAGIGFFAVAVTASAATAAIVTLAFTLGFWVLDFMAGSAGTEWLRALGELSPTIALKQSERGMFSLPHVLRLASIGIGLMGIAALLIRPGEAVRAKLPLLALVALGLVAVLAAAPKANFLRDLSEDRRNSFNPADEAALARMDRGLAITLYLAPEDSRARELETNVLAKLKRLVPHLLVRYGELPASGPFGAAQDDRYGLIVYEYRGRRAESRSNSAREILPLLHELAGVAVSPVGQRSYPGYPLTAAIGAAPIWFYGALPALAIFLGWRFSRPGSIPGHLTKGDHP